MGRGFFLRGGTLQKAIFFIDGFNLYHSLIDPRFNDRLSKYKWLDLVKLSKRFLQSQEVLADVYYFTALCSWNEDKRNRHQLYMHALENAGIKIILGKFKGVSKTCRAICKRTYKTFEEKRTDVNIAIHLLSLVKQYDIAYLMTADSDLIPAIEEIKKSYPEKRIVVVIPFNKRAEELKSVCHSHMKIKEIHLLSSQFDPIITLTDGSNLSCPTEWT
jgi:uncharacterized LabA/DUF88 family protein